MTLFLRTLMNMSLTAAFVAVVVFLLRLVLKGRTARQMVCLLWLLVFARLLIPVTLQSPVSLVPDMELSNSSPVVSTQPEAVPTLPVNTSPMVTAPPNVSAPAVTYPVQNPAATIPPNVSAPAPVVTPPAAEPSVTEDPAPFPWGTVLTVVWAIGVAAMLVYGVSSYLSIRWKLRFAIRTKEGWWEDPHLRSPFILGLVRPKIYLPCHMTPYARRFILSHERAHIRRGDHIIKPLCWLALALHWFNPLAWVAFLLLSRDIEVACDEKVLREMGSEVKADYSATLLALATNGRFPAPTPLAFGEGDAKTRIKGVLSFKKPALWVTIAAVAVAIVAAVCLLTDPVDKFDPDDYTTQDCYPGLYFERTVVEETGETTVKAYALEDGKPVLVAGWSDHLADNLATLIHPDGEKEVRLAFPWEITYQYEQYLVDYMMEQDEDWAQRYIEEADDLVTFLQAKVYPYSSQSDEAQDAHPSGFIGGIAYTPEENLLFCWEGTAQVLPRWTPYSPNAHTVKVYPYDRAEDGTDRLDILWTGKDVTLSTSFQPVTTYTGDALITYIWDGETWTAHNAADTIAFTDKPVSFDAANQRITVTYDPNAHTNGNPDIAQIDPGIFPHQFPIPEELGRVQTIAVGEPARISRREDGDYDLTYGVYAMPEGKSADTDWVRILDMTAILKWNSLTEEFEITFTGANSTYTAPDGLTTIGSLPEEDVYLYTDGKNSFWMEAYGHYGSIDILNASAAQLNLSTLADLSKGTATNLSGPDFEIVSFTVQNKHTKNPVSYILMWDGDQNIWDTCPYVTTLSSLPRDIVTGETYPENPEWYYKVAETEQYSLYARNHGAEVLLQYGNFSWTFGNIAHTPHRNLPVMKELDEETVAVISEVNTGTGVNVDELVVYDATLPVATDYRYDWRELAADFNRNNTLTYDKASNSLTLGWNGKTYSSGVLAQDLSVGFALEAGFSGALIATGDQIRFTPNGDGTFTVRMNTSIGRGNNGSFSDYQAGWFWQSADEDSYVYPMSIGITGLDLVWTVRFTGDGFEVVESPAVTSLSIPAQATLLDSLPESGICLYLDGSGQLWLRDEGSFYRLNAELCSYTPTEFTVSLLSSAEGAVTIHFLNPARNTEVSYTFVLTEVHLEASGTSEMIWTPKVSNMPPA